MADTVLETPDPEAFDRFIRAYGLALRAKDEPAPTFKAWELRRKPLREAMFQAMGTFPEKDAPLEPKIVGELKRDGYRIEKLTYQTRPDVWVTANAYVPQGENKSPAVLVVHGHWPWARIDPKVQARCLGLVKLGFFVLAVDAFGAGERYTSPARGSYHGALYGSTLWPTGHTLLGMQVYDNRRAVDYLRTRPEVAGEMLGITGASGGGNQSMYAGSLDERIKAVAPVCSVGTFQAYLHAACCVCEVLPGALRFAEEGDVLSLVAPRALLVINATKDGFQFSVGEASKSLERARKIFKLYNAEEKLKHGIFESPHDYNQPMREMMYGWMMRWLKNEGDGKPVPEPKFQEESPDDLRCYPDGMHPKGFLFPPSFAGREGRYLVARIEDRKPDHVQEWEATAGSIRERLIKNVFGENPKLPKPIAKLVKSGVENDVTTSKLLLHPEPGMPLPVILKGKSPGQGKQPTCILLHLQGKQQALEHPLSAALLKKGWLIVAPDLRSTGETAPKRTPLRGASDHNSAEHALWVGRPMLGQWTFDVQCLLDWLGMQPGLDGRRLAIAGIGQAGIVALACGGIFDDEITTTIATGSPTTYVTDLPYADGFYMGLLAPGVLRYADIPQLAALSAPKRLILADSVTPQGRKLTEKGMREAFAFVQNIYQIYKSADKLTIHEGVRPEDWAI